MLQLITKYSIDTSSLINMKDNYPHDIFEKLWNNIEIMINLQRLIAPVIVKKEIDKGYDILKEWANQHNNMFIKIDIPIQEKFRQICAKIKSLNLDVHFAIDTNPYAQADLWVIALAMRENNLVTKCSVISDENPNKPAKIPGICKLFGINCFNTFDFFRNENWKF